MKLRRCSQLYLTRRAAHRLSLEFFYADSFGATLAGSHAPLKLLAVRVCFC